MNLQHLYYFQKLSELQHYAQTANTLNVSQSNLSYAISSLEKELDVELFEKRGRNVHLSADGELFLEYVNRALRELETGKDAVSGSFALSRNTVRVGAFNVQAAYELIEEFKAGESHPEINFILHHRKSFMTLRDLKNKKVDIGICSYTKPDPTLTFIPMQRQNFVALLHHQHPLADRETLDLREIARYPVIIPNGSSDGMYRKIIGLFDAIGETPIQNNEAEFVSAAAYLAGKGYGITLAVYAPVFHQHEVKIIPVTHPSNDFRLYLAYAKDLWHSRVVNAFIEYVKAKVSEQKAAIE